MSVRDSFKAPATAWPTILLALACLSLLAFALLGVMFDVTPPLMGGALSFVAIFAAFTPLHDATHRAVSRTRWVNEAIGRVSSLCLLSPFAAFRAMHLEHHKHTNDPHRDPDHYSGRGAWWALPLRWVTQDLHYYLRIVGAWHSRPRAERVEVVLSVAVFASLLGALTWAGYGEAVLLAWVIPARLAIAALSFSFDYLPHVPHQTPASEDRFAATRILIAPSLSVLFLFQNYHLIHHLYPGVPFYRYRAVYHAQAQSLAAKGARWLEL
jgi:beta-carotene hydroxylase